jgi:hypothetical protein
VQQTLEICQTLLKKTQQTNDTCIEQVLRPATSKKQKLLRVFNEIQKQTIVIQNLVFSLKSKIKKIITAIGDFKLNADKSVVSLKSILERLSEKKLHAFLSFKPINMEETIEKNTLFDFVNIQSVNDLQTQSIEEINEISAIEVSVKDILIQIEEEFVKISKSSSKIQITELDELDSDPLKLNKIELQKCVNNLLVIAGYYDKIQYLISHPKELENTKFEFKDISSVKYQIEMDCTVIAKRCAMMENRGKMLSDFFTTAHECYNAIETISSILPNKILQVDQLDVMFRQRCITNQSLFDEIGDLTHWYHLFYKSYDHLIVEIDRRNKTMKQAQNMIKNLNEQLNGLYSEELEKRSAFNEEFGGYLPQTLCPSIHEQPTKFQVFPESIKTQLPNFELTQEEKNKLDL